MPLQRCGIGTDFVGQVLGRGRKPLVAPHLGPSVEGIEGRRIRDVGIGRSRPGAGERALAGTEWCLPTLVGELGAAANDGQLQLAALRAVQQRKPVLSGFSNMRPAVRAVDAIGDGSRRTWNRQPNTSFEKAHELVGLQIDRGVVIEVQRAAVGKEDLDASPAGADAVPRQQRHAAGGVVTAAVALEEGDAVDESDVRGGLGVRPRHILRLRRGCPHARKQTCKEDWKRP
jgi:hypothetical protein